MSPNSASVLIRNTDNGTWSVPETSAYENEDHLQALLGNDPSHIPGIPQGSSAVRELSTSAGPIDICVVTDSGDITVVECKLARNSERRRMVVGQVIDYASAIRSDGPRAFREQWAKRRGADLDDFLDPTASEDLEDNIRRGRMNLCLAVDQIDPDLRRLVEYLNLVTSGDIMVSALQLAYARHGDTEILIPSTYGTELAATSATRNQPTEHWTWATFIESLEDPNDQHFATETLNRLQQVTPTGSQEQIWYGLRPRGSLLIKPHGNRYGPFYFWLNSVGQLKIYGSWRMWKSVDPQHFDDLAAFLGQSHLEGAKGILAADIDLDAFWEVALDCDQRIQAEVEIESSSDYPKGTASS